jgi:ABC-type glycerol-3-phosphate transport system substrate-binding protein
MIPTLLAQGTRHGYLYSIPYSAEIDGLVWRPDLAAQAGITHAPRTWAELKDDIVIMAKHLHGRKDYVLGTDSGVDQLQQAFIQSATKHPFTQDGMIDWLSPEAQQALAFLKDLSKMKGVYPRLISGDAPWTAGFMDFYIAPDSRVGWLRKLLGPGSAAFAPTPERCVGCGSGDVYWGNGFSLLKGALHPAEATNFLVWALGPADSAGLNLDTLKSGKTPVYSTYIDKVRTDPAFAQYRWMLPMFDQINHSIVTSATPYMDLIQTWSMNWWPKYVDSNMTAKQYGQHIIDDINAAIKRGQM